MRINANAVLHSWTLLAAHMLLYIHVPLTVMNSPLLCTIQYIAYSEHSFLIITSLAGDNPFESMASLNDFNTT